MSDATAAATFTAFIRGCVLTVKSITSGDIAVGMEISGSNVIEDSIVISYGTGLGDIGTYVLSTTQNVDATTMKATVSCFFFFFFFFYIYSLF